VETKASGDSPWEMEKQDGERAKKQENERDSERDGKMI
jgi:hypothetical protein